MALFLGNSLLYGVTHPGIQKRGAAVCPCGPLNKAPGLHYPLDHLQARMFVAAVPLLAVVAAVRATSALAAVLAAHCADLLPAQPSIDVSAGWLQMRADAPAATRTLPASHHRPARCGADDLHLGHPPSCQGFEAAYGLSKTHFCNTYRPRHAVRWGTHGRPVTNVRSRTPAPESGAKRTTGAPGEVVPKRRGGALGYWKKPEATAKTLRRLFKNET